MPSKTPSEDGWIRLEKSSNLSALRYDAANQTLTVEFTSGVQYNYLEVPFEVVSEMLESGSKGQYLNKSVKGQYKYVKVEQEEDDGCDA